MLTTQQTCTFFLAACWLFPPTQLAGAQEIGLIQPADTSSPRATLYSLIDSCNEFHALVRSQKYFKRNQPEHRSLARRIVDCIDTSEIPEFAQEEVGDPEAEEDALHLRFDTGVLGFAQVLDELADVRDGIHEGALRHLHLGGLEKLVNGGLPEGNLGHRQEDRDDQKNERNTLDPLK